MSTAKIEFGDFQTPQEFATGLVSLLRDRGFQPRSIIEPTCGTGSFLKAASIVFPESALLGIELNPEYAAIAKKTTWYGSRNPSRELF